MTPQRAISPYLVLSIGILAVSSAAILISFARAEGVPAVSIAALRLTFASLALAPFVWTRARGEWAKLAPRDFALALVSGVSLALHFAFWISSLDYTSVMSSVVFVSTNPLFVGLASVLLLRESLRRGTIIGIVVAGIGGALDRLFRFGASGRGIVAGRCARARRCGCGVGLFADRTTTCGNNCRCSRTSAWFTRLLQSFCSRWQSRWARICSAIRCTGIC